MTKTAVKTSELIKAVNRNLSCRLSSGFAKHHVRSDADYSESKARLTNCDARHASKLISVLPTTLFSYFALKCFQKTYDHQKLQFHLLIVAHLLIPQPQNLPAIPTTNGKVYGR